MTNFEMVREFHERFGHPVATTPEFPSSEVRDLRLGLIDEEMRELSNAESDDDFVEVADALTDLLYVIYGMGQVYGIDLDACFAEVHRSNMAKLDADGNPIVREDGKILKPSGWQPPGLKSILYPELL